MTDTVLARLQRDVVRVSGPDATSFLQSLLSQDLDPVAVNDTVHALLLEPRGKLVVDMHAKRTEADTWLLVCEGGFGSVLADGLNRFKIRVKVDIEQLSSTFVFAVRGPDAQELMHWFRHEPLPHRTLRIDWGAAVGYEVVCHEAVLDEAIDQLSQRGAREIDADAYDALRIEAGVPRQGFDIDETTIAQEAYLERDAVSFTKGCFVGQELVCRIDSRGHVNRLLRRLRADSPLDRGATVEADGKAVGTVTSSAGPVALAMLRREVEPGSSVLVRAGTREVTARVEAIGV
jgi:folate-binding protein YgfZ